MITCFLLRCCYHLLSGGQINYATTDQPISHTAQNLGISDGLLRRWIKEQSNTAKKPFTGQGNPRDEELTRLKKELVDVKRERDFLREAAAYFSKQSK
ncbi:MAG: transposase [Porticoccaceae bacterium]|nr:transposase [Porticoccaceae bacterium]